MTQALATHSRNAPCPCGSGEKYKRCCGAASAPPAPPAPRALFTQGVQLLRAGQAAAAVPALLAAVEANRTHFDAHHALGTALLQTGRFAEASAILFHAVALRPGSAAALWDLGAAYDHQDLHEQAIGAYQRAVALSPNLGDVQLRLGQLYAQYSRAEEASACLERAADAKPNTVDALLYRSDAALLRGDVAAAEQSARRAVERHPANDTAHGAVAGTLYNQGRFEEAEVWFEAALRLNPRAGKYWDGLAHCRKYTVADDGIVERMQSALRRADMLDGDRMALRFAMGKVYDDLGDYARAMEQFDAANRLRGRDVTFDRAGLAALVDRNIEIFTPAFFARHPAASTDTEKPLFIVGMFRSGTTLVEQIISSHNQVAAGGELTVWTQLDLEIDPATGGFAPARTPAAVARYLGVLEKIAPTALRVTDKLPTNLFRLGAIHALMPHARIMHCVRHPIDTCLSIYSTPFSSRVPFAARKDDLAFYYRQYARMMEHWRRVLPAEVLLDMQYEALVADRAAETRRMIAFAGLDWDEQCLRPEANTRAIGTSSAWQARQPVYGTSLERWRRYEPWIGELRGLG